MHIVNNKNSLKNEELMHVDRIHTSIIVPTLNEEKTIDKVLSELPHGPGIETIVVDGLSTDNTVSIAKKHGATVVLCAQPGKGVAMVYGTKAAHGSIIAYIDGDDTYDPNPLKEFVELVQTNQYDMIVGKRILEPGSMSLVHRIGNRILSSIASVLYEPVSDLLSGMRVMRKDDLFRLNLSSRGFGIETEMFVKASKKKLKIKEIPVQYHHRMGNSKLSGLKDGLRVFLILIKYVLVD